MVEKERYLVVVSVLEGRKFPKRPKHRLIAEAKFDGELLATDAVDHEENPDFTQELAWELDKKGLHQHRMQRTSIKVQCYAVDTTSTVKEAVGYVVLDIRSAQNVQTAKWYPLLHTKYQRAKPELRLGIYLDNDKVPLTKSIKSEEKLQQSTSGNIRETDFDPALLKPVLNDVDGYYQIGPEKQCTEQFIISVTVAFAANLPHLIPSSVPLPANANGYFFYYSLLGNDVTNEAFFDLLNPTFPAERASVRVRSSVDALRVFFSNQPGLQIHLCCGDQSLGSAEIPLNTLLKKGSTEIYMKPVTVEGAFELFPPNRMKQKLPPISEDMKPVVGVSIILRREDQSLTVTPVKAQEKNNTPVDHRTSSHVHSPPEKLEKPASKLVDRAPSPLPPHEGSYTDTFEDSSVQEKEKAEQNSGKMKKSIHKETTIEKTTETSEQMPPMSQDTEATSPTQLTSVTQPTVLHKTENHVTSVPSQASLTTSTTTTQAQVVIPAQTHHFCCSIDLQAISSLDVSTPVNVFLRYTYPFFGSAAPILTQPPVEMSRGMQVALPQSFCAFDFATSPSQLQDIFTRVPLIIEIWDRDKQRSQNNLLGVTQVHLSSVLDKDKVHAVHSSGASGSRQVYEDNLPVISSAREGRIVGELHVTVSLEDWGLITTPHIVQPQHGEAPQSTAEPAPPPPEPRETQEYKAALELEMWKETQENMFENQLKVKELQHMKTLADEWRRRDKEREVLVKKKLAEYGHLEAQLQKTISDLDLRDKQLAVNEQEVIRLRKDLHREHENKLMEMREASRRMKEDCDHQVQLERAKVTSMEEQVSRLKLQLTEMEQKYHALDKEFSSYKEQQNTKPEVRLQSEINLLTLEKVELERKIDALTKSKIHYKQQWGRALKELARLKQKEQQIAHAELRRQQQELEHMRLRYLAAEEKEVVKADQKELESIKSELNKLKEQEVSIAQQNKVIENGLSSERPAMTDDDEHIARLIEERDTLLRTGVYTTEDSIIAELDRQIREAIAKKAS